MTDISLYGQVYSIDPDRLWNKAVRTGTCLLWTGAGSPHYGHMALADTFVKVHVVAYALVNGPVPDGYIVRHSCDTPPCIEPTHLLLGSYKDNSQDMVERGRADFSRRVFTPQDLIDIRDLYQQGARQRQIAELYGVQQSTISRLLTGARYAEWLR